MTDDDDRLAPIEREACAAFDLDKSFAERLRGGNRVQIFDDARWMHQQSAHATASGWPSFEAALHVLRRDREALARRLFGRL
jgi:hypothetical protein